MFLLTKKYSDIAKTFFKEKQRFDDKVVLVTLGLISFFSLIGSIKYLLSTEVIYTNALFLFSVFVVTMGAIWWLTRLKMKVSISEKGIKYKITPLHEKKRFLAWEEIDNCKVVQTSEIAKWSGGNIAFPFEKMMSLTGRNGLAIETKDGERYFIGSKDVEELQQALHLNLVM